MARVAWVTDSTAYIDEELKNHPDVYTIPMTILLDEEEFLDGIELSPHQLFERLKSLKTPPKTSQPSIGEFRKLYTSLSETYDYIISVHVSSNLSGTVSSSEQAAQMVDIPVTTIDSKILTYPLSALIKLGISCIDSGLSIQETKKRIEQVAESNETYVLIGSLEQLHRSGRMSGVQFLLGSMLSIKPIITIENGSLNVKEKARSEKKAKEKIAAYLRESLEKHSFKEVYILYGLHEDSAKSWQSELEAEFPDIRFICCPLGATIGVHAGEHTLGISWFRDLK
ncbi:DegV family protein [Bacillus methanolicus]|uniref:DegV family protein n=1 Tax=Bacillus methanolicus TaxID=1471 RepID=UPI0023809D80|nr:DegV family protein [Bacillus methanolicus]MDE3839298.1 DegV family protein [Bacillus methanolicus]